MEYCNKECNVYSRIVGYYRPVSNWNRGKEQEFHDRREYSEEKAMRGTVKNAKVHLKHEKESQTTPTCAKCDIKEKEKEGN